MTAQRRELERVNAFSDGVFAIAITLLVLNIDVPDVATGELGHAIKDLGDDLLAYAIGFAVMGLFWYGHHRLFSRLARSDGRLVLTNMLLLGLVGLMPFSTGVLGNYDGPLAVSIFAANVGLATIVDGFLHLIARNDELEEPDAVRMPHELSLTWARAVVFLVSIPIAYLASPEIAQYVWLLLIAIVFLRRWG